MNMEELYMAENQTEITENITLNGKVMTQEQFEEEKKSLTEKKIQVVNVGKNTYTTRMCD